MEQIEAKLKKLLKEAKKSIADLKGKMEILVAELSMVKEELVQQKELVN